MSIRRTVLNELIEPVLFAVRNGRQKEIEEILREVSVRKAQIQGIESNQAADALYSAGVLEAFQELLRTSLQRSVFNDALALTRAIIRGLDILREVDRTAQMGEPAPQLRLAQSVGEDPGNFSRKVRRLVEANLLTEKRGKSVTYELTPLGADVLDELCTHQGVLQSELSSMLSDQVVRKDPLSFTKTSALVWRSDGALSSDNSTSTFYVQHPENAESP